MSETAKPFEQSGDDDPKTPFGPGVFTVHNSYMDRYAISVKPTETGSFFSEIPDSLNDDD